MSKKANEKKIRSQPKLKTGPRIPRAASMHEAVIDGLRKIAKDERKSVSWVIHEIIADFFGRDIMGEKL